MNPGSKRNKKEKPAIHKITEFELNSPKSEEVLKSFLNQFAENQNHHQRLYIQFLSSVLIVLIAYVFVYTNTAGYEEIIVKGQKQVTSEPYNTIKSETGSIVSYARIHLFGIYLFAQFVFIVLIAMILHMGYSFRRDQVVIHKIRKKYLGINSYWEIFGKDKYMGYRKNWLHFLPNFNGILFWAIFALQILLFLSMVFFVNKFGKKIFFFPIESLNTHVPHFLLYFILALPLLLIIMLHNYYYHKYDKVINHPTEIEEMKIVEGGNQKM